METQQLTLPFANESEPVLINFPLRQSDAELALLRKFPARRSRSDRFAYRWGLNRRATVVAFNSAPATKASA